MTSAADPVAAVRGRFLTRCRDDVKALEGALAKPGPESSQTLKFTVHRLSGAAGVFGFHAISHMAGGLDDILHAGEEPEAAEIESLIAAVKAILPA